MPATRITTGAPPVQLGKSFKPMGSPAPRITTTAPQMGMPRSLGPKYMKSGGKISTAEGKCKKCAGW